MSNKILNIYKINDVKVDEAEFNQFKSNLEITPLSNSPIEPNPGSIGDKGGYEANYSAYDKKANLNYSYFEIVQTHGDTTTQNFEITLKS